MRERPWRIRAIGWVLLQPRFVPQWVRNLLAGRIMAWVERGRV